MVITNREKRYSTDIGKDSDDLIGKLKLLAGNKKLNKQQTIYRALEFCYIMRLDLSEVPEKPVLKKDLEKLKNELTKTIQGYNADIASLIKLVAKNK